MTSVGPSAVRPPTTWAEVLLSLLLGATFLVVGILVRSGRNRRWVAHYRNPQLPTYLRNGALVAWPSGVAFLTLGVGAALTLLGDSIWLFLAALTLMAVGFALVVVCLVWAYRPPNWLKPLWLRVEEEATGPPEQAGGLARAIDYLPLGFIVVLLIALLVLGGLVLLSSIITGG